MHCSVLRQSLLTGLTRLMCERSDNPCAEVRLTRKLGPEAHVCSERPAVLLLPDALDRARTALDAFVCNIAEAASGAASQPR